MPDHVETPLWQVSIRLERTALPVGAGLLCTPKHVLTCAHVLGDDGDPEKLPAGPVFVEFRFTERHEPIPARALPEAWVPERPDGSGDIAVLELLGPPPARAVPAPLRDPHAANWDHDFRAFGYPKGHERTGVWSMGKIIGEAGADWLQLLAGEGYTLESGFSGAPVWDGTAGAVAGIVVSRDRLRARGTDTRTGYAIPVGVLARSWPALEAGGAWSLDREPEQPAEAGLGVRRGAEIVRYLADIERAGFHQAPALPPVPPIPRLPFDAVDVVGRADDLKRLAAAATSGAVVVISGPPGVGKTALVIDLAYRLRDTFGDGELYVDLRGLRPDRLGSADALRQLGRALGVPEKRLLGVGPDLVEAVRERAADRAVITVLDNVDDAAQVRQLCRLGSGPTIITSRRPLASLATTPEGVVPIGLLSADDAEGLLSRLVGEERANREAAELRSIAQLCGRLPLALTIAGHRLRARPDRPASFLVERLRNERRRLGALEVDDLAVRASFRLSYDDLNEVQRELFRGLGVHPGPRFSLACAAGLIDQDPEEMVDDLDALIDGQLVEDRARVDEALLDLAPVHGLQELLGVYARELIEERRAALEDRLLEWYAGQAEGTGKLLVASMKGQVRLIAEKSGAVRGADARASDPMRWFEAERSALLNVAALAHERKRWGIVARLEAALRLFQRYRGYHVDRELLARWAVEAREALGDPAGVAVALLIHGEALLDQERYPEADEQCSAAIAALGDGEPTEELGRALLRRSEALAGFGELGASAATAREALVVWRKVSPSPYAYVTAYNVAMAAASRSDWGLATEFLLAAEPFALPAYVPDLRHRIALSRFYNDDDPELVHAAFAACHEGAEWRRRAVAWTNEGRYFRSRDDFREAARCFAEAATLSRDNADDTLAAECGTMAAAALLRADDVAQAGRLIDEALPAWGKVGARYPREWRAALALQGVLTWRAGDLAAAREQLATAVDLAAADAPRDDRPRWLTVVSRDETWTEETWRDLCEALQEEGFEGSWVPMGWDGMESVQPL